MHSKPPFPPSFFPPQEQLQLNLLQQTHLSAGSGKANASALQSLQQQQQQLVTQMQMTQQALMLGTASASATSSSASGDSPATISVKDSSRASPATLSSAATIGKRERHASETFGSTGSEGSLKENSRPDNNNLVEQQQQQLLLSAFKAEQILNGKLEKGRKKLLFPPRCVSLSLTHSS